MAKKKTLQPLNTRYEAAHEQAVASTRTMQASGNKVPRSYKMSLGAIEIMEELQELLGFSNTQSLETGVRMLGIYHGIHPKNSDEKS